jgi:hypothetical protein
MGCSRYFVLALFRIMSPPKRSRHRGPAQLGTWAATNPRAVNGTGSRLAACFSAGRFVRWGADVRDGTLNCGGAPPQPAPPSEHYLYMMDLDGEWRAGARLCYWVPVGASAAP